MNVSIIGRVKNIQQEYGTDNIFPFLRISLNIINCPENIDRHKNLDVVFTKNFSLKASVAIFNNDVLIIEGNVIKNSDNKIIVFGKSFVVTEKHVKRGLTSNA